MWPLYERPYEKSVLFWGIDVLYYNVSLLFLQPSARGILDFWNGVLYHQTGFGLYIVCRCGGTGRRKGLKIPRWKHRTGSIPVSGTTGQGRSQAALRLFLFVQNCGPRQNQSKVFSGTKNRQAPLGARRFLFIHSSVYPKSHWISHATIPPQGIVSWSEW